MLRVAKTGYRYMCVCVSGDPQNGCSPFGVLLVFLEPPQNRHTRIVKWQTGSQLFGDW